MLLSRIVDIMIKEMIFLYTDRVSDSVVGAHVHRIQIELLVLDPRAIGETQLQSGYSDDPIGGWHCFAIDYRNHSILIRSSCDDSGIKFIVLPIMDTRDIK